jgi:hypothetical protein
MHQKYYPRQYRKFSSNSPGNLLQCWFVAVCCISKTYSQSIPRRAFCYDFLTLLLSCLTHTSSSWLFIEISGCSDEQNSRLPACLPTVWYEGTSNMLTALCVKIAEVVILVAPLCSCVWLSYRCSRIFGRLKKFEKWLLVLSCLSVCPSDRVE